MSLRARLITMGLAAALVIIPAHEGLRLQPYKDPIGIPTECYGHTGPDVVMGKFNSLQQCEDKLDADVLTAYNTVRRCVKVPLSDAEASAYTSFAFNVGPGKPGVKDGFCVLRSGRTPTFLSKLNSGDRVGACTGILVWDKAGGKQLRGLVTRRHEESTLCLSGVRGSSPQKTLP